MTTTFPAPQLQVPPQMPQMHQMLQLQQMQGQLGAPLTAGSTGPLMAGTTTGMAAGAQARRAQLNREAVLSATPVRLLTMLYDRLMLDLARAESAQVAETWQVASENLLHAQAIVDELTTSLNVTAWDGADGLLAVYTYVSNALIGANIHRDVARTRESIALLEPLRQAWHEAAGALPAPQTAPSAEGYRGVA